MAHEKLSPRQKMIGMMYLVLTAMLALNVSKEAIDAFKKIDKGLNTTLSNYALKNNLVYDQFTRAAAENPQKAGELKNKAFEVKLRADEAYNFLQDLKIEIITKAEGAESLAIKGDEVDIEEVKKIDENNIPSEVLIGSNQKGKATDLKAMLNEYREYLLATLDGRSPTSEEVLRTSLSTDEMKDKDGQSTPWENGTFQALPLVAVIATLSKMQLDVRNAETEVLNYLYTQIDASSFKFNKIFPVVIPTSNYVTVGDEYQAQVFISATDTTQQPDIILTGGQKLELDEAGRGVYKARATATGEKKWGGVIALKSPSGAIINYPFNASYNVGEPNVIVSATAMNVLYVGIDNPLDVSVPGISPDKIKIRVVNGESKVGKMKNSKGETFRGNWLIKPNAAGQNVQVIVTADMNGKPVQMPPYEFRVKPLPTPIATFANKSTGSVSRASAAAQQGVFAIMPDFDFDLTYKVTEFKLFYTDRGLDIEEPSTSSQLTAKQKALLEKLTRGKTLIIKDIRAVGPDGKTKDLLPVVLKID
jgi:gliding motility-associated protein GldM